MTDYTSHPDALFDPNKPILGSVALQARDNLVAVMEGAANAPRLAVNAQSSFGAITGATLLSFDFTDLEDFQGVRASGSNSHLGGGPSNTTFSVALSDDNGSSFYTAQSVGGSAVNNELYTFDYQIDFLTGVCVGRWGTLDSAGVVNLTLAGGGTGVDAVRFSARGRTSIMVTANGGASAT